jgi:hypothetical protein
MKKLMLALLLLSMLSCTTEDSWNGPTPYGCSTIIDKSTSLEFTPGTYDKYYKICTGSGQLPAYEVSKEEYDKYTFQGGSWYWIGYKPVSVYKKINLSGRYYVVCSGIGNFHIFEIDKTEYNELDQIKIKSGNVAYCYFGNCMTVTDKTIVPGKVPNVYYNLILSGDNKIQVSKQEYDTYNQGNTYCLYK